MQILYYQNHYCEKGEFMRYLWIFCFFCLLCAEISANDVYFTSHPCLSPDGSKVVFSYENDLWVVSSKGGMAYRIVSMQGIECYPRISPDGKWLAFSGMQNGNFDVYVMPMEGGMIRQLTYHSSSDLVESWDWDSKRIFFSSSRYNKKNSYSISVEGGTAKKIFEKAKFFDPIHNVVRHPKSGAYFFSESEESLLHFRKHYKGANNPNIKSFDFKNHSLKLHTTYQGKDLWTTISANGAIYFASDRGNGEYNLYELRGKEKIALTKFSTSIRRPQVSANGEKIVFEKDYQIFIYDIKSKKSYPLKMQLSQNDVLSIEQSFSVQKNITNFDVSPDGKKFAFVARGRLFISDTTGKFVRELKTKADERVMEVRWLSDSIQLIFTRTTNGWLNIFTISADGKKPERQMTYEKMNHRCLELSHDRKKVVYLCGRNLLKLMDTKTFKSETIAEKELWGYLNSRPNFSPDDRFVAYTAFHNFEQDIYIYDTKEKKSQNLTRSGVTETAPFWSPDGKYLYFSSDRFHPLFPRGTKNSNIYRMRLRKFPSRFRSDQVNALFQKSKAKASSVKVEIDPQCISYWEQVSKLPGNEFLPFVVQTHGKTHILYFAKQQGELSLWKTTYSDFSRPRTQKIKGSNSRELIIGGYSEHQVCASQWNILFAPQ